MMMSNKQVKEIRCHAERRAQADWRLDHDGSLGVRERYRSPVAYAGLVFSIFLDDIEAGRKPGATLERRR